MNIAISGLRRQYQISSLCTVFTGTLNPCNEEGVPRHYVHQLPCPVVLDDRGRIVGKGDCQVAVLTTVKRSSPLLPHMEDDLHRLAYHPTESLYLAIESGDPVIQQRVWMLEEYSRISLDLVGTEETATIVAISHRRKINGFITVRHYPVALLDGNDELLWVHPASLSYGLIRCTLPSEQRVRSLGPRTRPGSIPEMLRCLDDESGLPAWYRFAMEHLEDLGLGEKPTFQEVLGHQAHLWLQGSIIDAADAALLEASQQYMSGFERFFGRGGLHPAPGRMDFM